MSDTLQHDRVVYSLAFRTWADAVFNNMSFSPDRIAQQLAADPAVRELVVSDPIRHHAARLRRRRRDITRDQGFPYSPTRSFVQPRRFVSKSDYPGVVSESSLRRLDAWLRRQAGRGGADPPVLVTSHPMLAACADRDRWADVVYYGWDDWLAFPLWSDSWDRVERSYRTMVEHDVNVIGVSQALVDRIGAERSTVVPNGLRSSDFDDPVALPDWFEDVPGPVALYAGSLQGRIDVEGLAALAADLPEWSLVLVGYAVALEEFAPLVRLPNVHLHDAAPHPTVLSLMAAADVCLVPHRATPLTAAMSPLKLYEYLAAGAPVVATDLAPMRGVSDRVRLVASGEALAPAVLEAASWPKASAEELQQFRARHDWSQRYRSWRSAALGG